MTSNQMSQEIASSLWEQAIALRGSGKKGNIKKAIELATRILEERINPADVRTKLNTFIGDCYHVDLKKHDAAMAYYRAAIEITDDPWANVMLGSIYLYEKKDYRAAFDILNATVAKGIYKPGIRDIAQDYLAEARKKLA